MAHIILDMSRGFLPALKFLVNDLAFVKVAEISWEVVNLFALGRFVRYSDFDDRESVENV